jgi:DNA-binding beta-propeller fold protein YncE
MKLKSCFPLLTLLISLESRGLSQGLPFGAGSILNSLQSITATTIPSNGDLNPYGVAFVPVGFPSGGSIAGSDLLVANFNNNSNLQGTGTTIVSISPTGGQSVFATSPLIGLDTALGVLSRGFVIVGNLPVTYPGGVATPQQGSLQIFNRNGTLISTLNDSALLDSPWDLTINDQGSQAQVFVSNVLSGTVTRLNLSVTSTNITVVSKTQIGSGYAHQPSAAAVVVGPTGLAYDPDHDTLYVASTADNKIFAIGNAGDRKSSAGTGFLVFEDQVHLHGPLGLVLAPNGNLITANGDAVNPGGTPNELVEFTPQGRLVAEYEMDAGAPGGAFGVASAVSQRSIRFASVDDDLNTVTIWNIRAQF